jgi:hypothetical protein
VATALEAFVDAIEEEELPDAPLNDLLARDLKEAAVDLGLPEVRYLVKNYYDMQGMRIASGHQRRSLGQNGEPRYIISWTYKQMGAVENTIKKVLDYYTRNEPTGIGAWSRSIMGIGPVISAGLLAHIDIEKCPTAGHIWSFAGLNPEATWERGQRRPWNADLKTLCWKLGESFVKVQNRDEDIYGHIYAFRRRYEDAKNERHEYAEQAAAILERKKIGKGTEAYSFYSQGMLPKAHIYARSKRYAVKLFLSAWHESAYFQRYGELPPLPYAVTHLEQQHAHVFWPPMLDMIPGLRAAKEAQRPMVEIERAWKVIEGGLPGLAD